MQLWEEEEEEAGKAPHAAPRRAVGDGYASSGARGAVGGHEGAACCVAATNFSLTNASRTPLVWLHGMLRGAVARSCTRRVVGMAGELECAYRRSQTQFRCSL
mgnify:CR=1 FL=1